MTKPLQTIPDRFPKDVAFSVSTAPELRRLARACTQEIAALANSAYNNDRAALRRTSYLTTVLVALEARVAEVRARTATNRAIERLRLQAYAPPLPDRRWGVDGVDERDTRGKRAYEDGYLAVVQPDDVTGFGRPWELLSEEEREGWRVVAEESQP